MPIKWMGHKQTCSSLMDSYLWHWSNQSSLALIDYHWSAPKWGRLLSFSLSLYRILGERILQVLGLDPVQAPAPATVSRRRVLSVIVQDAAGWLDLHNRFLRRVNQESELANSLITIIDETRSLCQWPLSQATTNGIILNLFIQHFTGHFC